MLWSLDPYGPNVYGPYIYGPYNGARRHVGDGRNRQRRGKQ
jgi:hypothetical protein